MTVTTDELGSQYLIHYYNVLVQSSHINSRMNQEEPNLVFVFVFVLAHEQAIYSTS